MTILQINVIYAQMKLRPDLDVISDIVPEGAKLLDIGCGEGELLEMLKKKKNIIASGIEIDQDKVTSCLQKGLSVLQGDVDEDLQHYPDNGFDYAVLTQSLQVTKYPDKILHEVLRIANHAIVSIPNFGYWENRLQLLLHGRMPVTKKLSYQWYETPNIHFCTIRDFVILCNDLDIKIEKKLAIKPSGKIISFNNSITMANYFAETGIFLIGR